MSTFHLVLIERWKPINSFGYFYAVRDSAGLPSYAHARTSGGAAVYRFTRLGKKNGIGRFVCRIEDWQIPASELPTGGAQS